MNFIKFPLALSESDVCALADEHCNRRLEGGAYLFKPFSLTLFAEAIQTHIVIHNSKRPRIDAQKVFTFNDLKMAL